MPASTKVKPMYKLYYSPGACSMAIHVVLTETGAPFQLERTPTSEGKTRTPEFLKLNPRGQVPVLEEDGRVMREGAAMLIYLCDKHNSPLLPREGVARAEALEWLMFCNATLHPAYSKVFWLLAKAGEAAGKEQLLKMSFDHINKLWSEVEDRLATRAYLCGEQPTAGDILLTVIGNWLAGNASINIGPKTRALFGRIVKRPSYQKALAEERIEYKMAS
jgi:glutathione S-transferase